MKESVKHSDFPNLKLFLPTGRTVDYRQIASETEVLCLVDPSVRTDSNLMQFGAYGFFNTLQLRRDFLDKHD